MVLTRSRRYLPLYKHLYPYSAVGCLTSSNPEYGVAGDGERDRVKGHDRRGEDMVAAATSTCPRVMVLQYE